MKKFLSFIITIALIYFIYTYRNEIIEYVTFNYIYKVDEVVLDHNDYSLNYNFNYVKQTNNLVPNNKQDIINIIYTGLNSGLTKFSFYCPNKYENCTNDVKEITSNQIALSNINNFVHPYNSYHKINMTLNSLGRIDIEIDKLYSDEEIILINNKVDEIIKENLLATMGNREKIKIIHDYIINHSKYDKEKANNLDNENYLSPYKSEKAYGPLFNGYAICSGYTDLMAIFLNKLNIPNYKISTDKHVWNLVYLDNKWYHLDLTWDDPIVNTGEDILLDKFFLIETNKLLEINTGEHSFDKSIFVEAN